MRITARRIDGGAGLRQAMADSGYTLQRLAQRTRLVATASDRGSGVSYQLIAFLATTKPYARETTGQRTAELIEDALSVPRGSLFEYVDLDAE